MSGSLLRQARLAHSFAIARRSVSRSRCYSALASQPRHESESQNAGPIAGPSHADALPPQDADAQEPYSRVQSYLASINTVGLQPTLQDLERYKPATRPPTNSPKYTEAYNEVMGTLCRSFTKHQLRKFLLESLGFSRHCATSRRKAEYAESVMEQLWQWPTLSELEKTKRDKTEVVHKMLPVTASELFLILGKDGADLLRLSQEYDVHISLRRKPLALRVEGPRGPVGELAAHIFSVKKTFVEELYSLPVSAEIPADMVQRISRLAQAYLENSSSRPGTIRICAKDAQGLEAAKRLASRAIHEIQETSQIPMLTYLPPGTAVHAEQPLVLYPHSYAFYPHMPHRSLPVTMNTKGAFRLRRVGEWIQSGYHENLDRTGGLSGEQGHIVTDSEFNVKLKDVLTMALPVESKSGLTTVKASLGHILLTRVSKDTQTTLVPPLPGDHPFGKIRKWISSNPVKMSFVPGIPLPLLNTVPAGQKVIHRLVYHSVSSIPQGHTTTHLTTHRRRFLTFEATLAEPKGAKPDESLLAAPALDALQSPDEDVSASSEPSQILDMSATQCTAGVQVGLNMMMPDRPMDLQFTVSNATDVPESQQPAELQRYARDLRAFLDGSKTQPEQPMPPSLLEHEGSWYLLHSNASVRQSVEMVSESSHADTHPVAYDPSSLTRTVCESMLELESNEKMMHCEVTCDSPTLESSWKQFLADCDRLTLMTYKSPNVTSLLSNPADSL